MFPKVPAITAVLCLAVAVLAFPFTFHQTKRVMAASTSVPAYTATGEMLPPEDYRG